MRSFCWIGETDSAPAKTRGIEVGEAPARQIDLLRQRFGSRRWAKVGFGRWKTLRRLSSPILCHDMASLAAGSSLMRKITRVLAFLAGFRDLRRGCGQAVIGSVVRWKVRAPASAMVDRIADRRDGRAPHGEGDDRRRRPSRNRFQDGTRLTVGEKAEIVLDTSSTTRRAATASTPRSPAVPLHLRQARAGATRQASVTTPFALIGVRGTDFWGGPSTASPASSSSRGSSRSPPLPAASSSRRRGRAPTCRRAMRRRARQPMVGRARSQPPSRRSPSTWNDATASRAA